MRDLYDIHPDLSETYGRITVPDTFLFYYRYADDDPEWDMLRNVEWWDHTPFPLKNLNPYTMQCPYQVYDSYLYFNFLLFAEDNGVSDIPIVMGLPGYKKENINMTLLYDIYLYQVYGLEADYGLSQEFVEWLDSTSLDPEHNKSNYRLIMEGPVGNKIRQFKMQSV
jgi:hypothetical protein